MILNALFEDSSAILRTDDLALDVPNLLRSLDEQHRCSQTQILETCSATEQRHRAYVAEKVSETEERLSVQIRQKDSEIAVTNEQLRNVTAQCRTAEAAIERMVAAVDSIQNIRQRFILQRQVYYAWYGRVKGRRCRAVQIERAKRHYAVINLQGNSLVFWRHWTRVERHSRAKIDMEASLRRQEDAVYAEANTRIEAMHAEVVRSTAVAEREVRLRAQVEKRMKDCFLRGVSALNLEAADIVHTSPTQPSEELFRRHLEQRDNLLPSTPIQSQKPRHDWQPPKQRPACLSQQPKLCLVDVTAECMSPAAAHTHEQFPTPLTAAAPCQASHANGLTQPTAQDMQQPVWFSQPPLCTLRRSWPSVVQHLQIEVSNDQEAPRKSFPHPMAKQ